MNKSKLFITIFFLLLTSASSNLLAENSCSSYGWTSQGMLSGPSRMLLGEYEKFSTEISNTEKSENDPRVDFYTSEQGYIGSKGYSSRRWGGFKSNIYISFKNSNSSGPSWVRAEEYTKEGWKMSELCIDVTVQRKPTVSMDITDLYAVGSSLRGTVDVSGDIDPYSLRGANSRRPAYTIEKKCEHWENWQTVQENSVSSTHDFAMNCNLRLRVRAFDGYYYSAYETVNIRYSDVDAGPETGPDSTACVQACPHSLHHRSRCMQSNPVCH